MLADPTGKVLVPIVGAVLSLPLYTITGETTTVLPQLSFTVYVCVTVQPQSVPVVTLAKVALTVPQLSVNNAAIAAAVGGVGALLKQLLMLI